MNSLRETNKKVGDLEQERLELLGKVELLKNSLSLADKALGVKNGAENPLHEKIGELSGKNRELREALLSMCEYANFLGLEMGKLGNANHIGDFVAQYSQLLKKPLTNF